MSKRITYRGSESDILELIWALPRKHSAIAVRRVAGNNIVIPTHQGARQVYVGDTVVIDGDTVTIEEVGQ